MAEKHEHQPEAKPGATGGAQDTDRGGVDPADEHHGSHEAETRPRPKQHATRAGALIGVLVALLGFAFVVQIRSNERTGPLASARQEDLLRILDDLDSRDSRLRAQISGLQKTQAQLRSGSSGDTTALRAARQRQRQLGILIGTIPATGPGLVITVTDRSRPLKAATLLDAVEELRGAGAEAMQIRGGAGPARRIGVSSYFLDAGGGIKLEGNLLTSPYTITVIGDPATLAAAMRIPGGVSDSVNNGGAISITQKRHVTISAIRKPSTPRYAKPAK